ncbi:hypothetical protein [Thalassomonas viridans]|nr:hypothetical protein [Thalassomonas viridans]
MMKISIEISLYPLAELKFKDEIWAFIKRLRGVDGLKVVTNGMSTQVFGDYDLAVNHVMAEIKQVHQSVDAAVFVCKFINGDRSVVEEKGA